VSDGKSKSSRRHRCLNRCHRCPHAGGEMLPFCMGGANGTVCTCPTPFETERDLRKEIDALKRDVAMLLGEHYRRARSA